MPACCGGHMHLCFSPSLGRPRDCTSCPLVVMWGPCDWFKFWAKRTIFLSRPELIHDTRNSLSTGRSRWPWHIKSKLTKKLKSKGIWISFITLHLVFKSYSLYPLSSKAVLWCLSISSSWSNLSVNNTENKINCWKETLWVVWKNQRGWKI